REDHEQAGHQQEPVRRVRYSLVHELDAPQGKLIDLLREPAGASDPDCVGGVEAHGGDRQQYVHELESRVEHPRIVGLGPGSQAGVGADGWTRPARRQRWNLAATGWSPTP